MRIGCVKYLNARPLIHGWPGAVILDHPSTLCRKLSAGELDVALVSSFEFLRNPIYQIVDGVSIASDGPVYSVVVAYEGDSALPDVELDPASETSVVLLQHVVNARGAAFRRADMGADALSPLVRGHARLLIGDQAIRFRQKYAESYRYWDLGEEWKRLTGLPFVYALWLVRPEVREASEVAGHLRSLRDRNIEHLTELIARETEFDPEFCGRYYTHHLRFSLGDREKAGLREFGKACANRGVIPAAIADLQLV